MPQYIDSTGRTVTADQALVGGKLRAGFNEILADGESAHFRLPFRDAAVRSSVYLTDTQIADAQITAFRDSPQGREYLAYLHSSPGAALTADAENEAIRKLIATSQPVTVDHAAGAVQSAVALAMNDPNAWRRETT